MKKSKQPSGNSKSSSPLQQSKPVTNSKKLIFYTALFCALLACILYSNTIGHSYTVDDGTVISNNKLTTQGISALPEIFSSSYRAGFWERNEGLYRPLSVAMFAIEWELSPDNPMPGHIINILLYGLTAFLLLITLSEIFKNYALIFPFSITVLFVVHPLHTEVVANIKSRDEILCLIFILLSFIFLLNYLKSQKVSFLIIASIVYFLAFLSKESAITILAFYPVLMWFKGKRDYSYIIKKTLPFLAAAIAYMFIRVLVLGELKGSPQLQLINNSMVGAEGYLEQLATAILVMGKYFYLTIVPHPLSFDYSYNQIPVVAFGDIRVIISAVVLISLVYLMIKEFKKNTPVALGLIFFFISISLVSNFILMIESTMAERFLYMPSVGLFIVIMFYFLKIFGNTILLKSQSLFSTFKNYKLFTSVFIIVMVMYSVKTISRSNEWKDNLTLLANDVETCPESARIRYAYGSAILIEQALTEENPERKKRLLNKSILQLEKGVTILPNYAEAWNHLGIAYKELENYPAATHAFEKARSYKEFKEADFYVSSGLAYGNEKKYDLAIADFTKAISIDPNNAEAFNNKGLYLFEKGVTDSALICFDLAISKKEGFYQAYYNKGNTLASLGEFTKAIDLYKQSLSYKPDYVDAWLNIGNSYAAMNDYNNALTFFSKVEKVQPGNKKVLINLGITYRFMGDENMAQQYFQKAEQIK